MLNAATLQISVRPSVAQRSVLIRNFQICQIIF